ncbi:MAG: bi-domain-containing oxidoreductase [Planctomycetota bacterium]
MQQVVQNIRTGDTSVQSIPAPAVGEGQLLIINQSSLVSAGTEKMIMDLAKKSLIGKARERPDHVKRVLEKIRNEGLFETIDAVRKKLNEPMKMGYSSAGIVAACGKGVQHFKPGDRVASNGPHAEVVAVPQNLCAAIPDSVSFDEAAFAMLGSIAVQGVRLAEVQLGETAMVVGLGLVGQLTVALLSSAGVRVIGTDLDEAKCELALKMGATIASPNLNGDRIRSLTGDLGADAVIITASTKSNGPIEVAAEAVRKKGRIVLVGVVGLEIDRRPFYFKECEFVVSCSYGPGRYDPSYEERGQDYPAAYVRWTQQRNVDAVLRLMGEGRLDVKSLISHRFGIDEAEQAYRLIEEHSEPYLGILLSYPETTTHTVPSSQRTIRLNEPAAGSNAKVQLGVIGAGNFARLVLLPAIAKSKKFRLKSIATSHGLSGTFAGSESGFENSTTDVDSLFDDSEIQALVSITRHNEHASHVLRALRANKHLFVEKPLCLTVDELTEIDTAVAESAASVTVGFNRRFSPAAVELKQFFHDCEEPLSVSFRFNAGDIPSDHWTQDELEGGGRIIGEACHAIDLASFLVGSQPVRVFAESVRNASPGAISDDRCFITLRHANGSISNIAYLAGGDRAFPKERIEVFGGGKVGVIDDFREITLCSKGKSKTSRMKRNKGHEAEILAWAQSLSKGGRAPIDWEDLRATTLASILAVRSLREGEPIWLDSSFAQAHSESP